MSHLQPTLFDLPPSAPRQPYRGTVPARDTDTSRAAAEMIRPKHSELQETIYAFVVEAAGVGLTAEEAGIRLAQLRGQSDVYDYSTRSTAAARLTELKLLGRIRDSGIRRKNRSGATAIAWLAVKSNP